MLQVEDNTPILEGGLYPVLEATGTPGLMKALKEVGEMKDEDASAAMMDFERLWNQYQEEKIHDTTQYGGSSGSTDMVRKEVEDVQRDDDVYDGSDF